MPATICKQHPITSDHVAQVVALIESKIDDARADAEITVSDMAKLFELRAVFAVMSAPAAKVTRSRKAKQNTAHREQSPATSIEELG